MISRPLFAVALGIGLASCASRTGSKELAAMSAETMRNAYSPEQRMEIAHEAWLQAVALDQQGQPQLALEAVQAAAFYDPDDRWLEVNLARRLRDFRRSKEALSILRRALTLPGEETSEEWELAAGLWLETGARDSAIHAWKKVLVLDPHSREALLGLAGLMEAADRPEEAAPLFARLAEEYGAQAAPIVERAAALWMRADRSDSAIVFLKKRWEEWHSPADGENLSRFLLSAGQSDAAAMLLDSVSDLAPEDSPRLELMAARALLAGGHRDEALQRFRHMESENPGDNKIRSSLGAILLDMDSLSEARTIFEKLRVTDSVSAIPYYFLGLWALKSDLPDSARIFLNRSLELDSEAIDTWIRRGMLELEDNKPDQAVSIFQRMAASWPKLPQARFLLGYSYARLAQNHTRHQSREWSPPDSEPEATALRRLAVLEFDTALAIDTGLHRVHFERGSALECLGEWNAAKRDLQSAVQENPNDLNAANYLGYMLADRGESLARADSLIERAVSGDPKNPSYLDSRAWIRFRLGRSKEALEDIDSAMAQGESDPTLKVHKASILESLHRMGEAHALWQAVLQVDPGYPEARKGLDRTK
jgi:tetratricopeptide (TPR) repeat protein